MKLTFSWSRKIRHVLWGSLVFSGFIVIWPTLSVTQQLEQATLDYRYAHFNREAEASDQVVFIDIDEQSMKLLSSSYGRWPWPRHIYKEILEFLSVGEPSGIFFDILFTEPQLGTQDDAQLAEVSSNLYVSHAMNLLIDSAEEQKGATPLPHDFNSRFGVKWKGGAPSPSSSSKPFQDFLLPAPVYLQTIKHIHAVTFDKDPDGVFRRVRWTFPYGDTWIPSLAFGGLQSLVPNPVVEKTETGLRLQGDSKQTFEVPLSSDGTILIHYYRPEKGPQTIPFAAVLASAAQLQKGEVADPAQLKVNPLSFKGKIIIIGGSAVGLADLKATPVHPSYPGPLLYATAISNVIKQDLLKRVSFGIRLGLGFLIVLAVYASVMFVENIWLKIGIPFILLLSYCAIASYSFYRFSLWMDIAMPLFLSVLAMLDGLSYISFVELSEKKKMKSALSKYLSPTVTEQIVASGKDPTAEVGHAQELSILFSDIRGFTTLSEQVEPQVLVSRLNDYLAKMTDEIFIHKGTLDKFIGDAVMAFWGAPLSDPRHAENAVYCAFGMIKALDSLRAVWAEAGKNEVPINIGIGINTGRVIVGNIGSDKRIDYTVIGDNVNLASRIEGLTKQYHSQFLVGEATYAFIQEKVVCRLMDSVQVKGKNTSVRIYEPLCLKSDVHAEKMAELAYRFEKAFMEYEKGSFEKALEYFNYLDQWAKAELKSDGDGPCQVYVERCRELIRTAPQNWTGVYIAKSK